MSAGTLTICVGWVEERNPTFIGILLGFATAQPNLLASKEMNRWLGAIA